ncbi:hypothetical protein E2C01_021457 [Portunus trituberculatus]|uniref:Uncharacterized protein n=1 Tax=Portunus trituberculatus TaxID=210409 RepID=A0A5B7E4I4_PORTR|nr:hypothetical protein [Portunus trituberculatus]
MSSKGRQCPPLDSSVGWNAATITSCGNFPYINYYHHTIIITIITIIIMNRSSSIWQGQVRRVKVR